MGKQIGNPFNPKNFGSDVNVCPSARTDSGGGRGESQDNPTAVGGMPSFHVAEVNNMAAGSLYARFSIR